MLPRSGTEHSSPHGGIPRRIISSPEGKIAMVVIQKLNNETIQGSQGTRDVLACAGARQHQFIRHGHGFISLCVIDTRQGEKPRGLFVLSGEKSSAPRPSPIQRFSPNPNGVAIWVIGSGRQGLAPFERDKQAAR